MGTVPMGTVDVCMIAFLMALMSPPVDRSMMVSAPAATETLTFASSRSRSTRSLDVPMLALIFVLSPLPIARGIRLVCLIFLTTTM